VKFVLLLSIFLFGYISAHPQVVDESLKIKQVRAAVDGLASTKIEIEFLIFNRTTYPYIYPYKGKVVGQTKDGFSLKIKKNHLNEILYKDVLVISGKNITVSFLPGPDLRAFGRWEAVQMLNHFYWLEVVLENGQRVRGRIIARPKDKITLVAEPIGAPHFTEFTLSRDQIVSVYRLFSIYGRGGSEGVSGGLKKGTEIGGAIGITPEGSAFNGLLGAGIGGIAGAVRGAGRKRPNSMWIMIYAK
jgi:hypothetical protein